MKGLPDIPGIRVGHASDFDALTGCTVILCDGGAVGGVDIRGSATGTSEIDVMNPGHVTDRVHAVVFAGGAHLSSEAASGVRRFLEKKGVGFDTGQPKCRSYLAPFSTIWGSARRMYVLRARWERRPQRRPQRMP